MFVDDIAFELLKQSPFYANLFRSCKIRIDNKMKYPACVLVKNSLEMVLNQDMLSKMPLSAQAGTVEHEFQHIMRRHIQQFQDKAHLSFSQKMGKPASLKVFNYAVDAEINPHIKAIKDDPTRGLQAALDAKQALGKLKEAKTDAEKDALNAEIEKLMKDGISVFPEFFDQQAGENWIKYYIALLGKAQVQKILMKMKGKGGKGEDGHDWDKQDGKGKSGKGDSEDEEYDMGGDHEYFEDSLNDPDIVDNVVYQACKEAESRTQGRLPGEVGEFLIEVEKKQALPWVTILRQFVHTLLSTVRHNNWKKVNRRFPGLLPGFKKEPKLKILVGLDESGSFGDDEWAEAMNEIQAIAAQGVEVWVAAFDTRITNYYKFERNPKPRSAYGGTSFVPVHEKAISERFNAVIMLTDGYGDYPDKKDVTYQSLWVMCTDYKAPYGVTVRLPNAKKGPW